MQKEYRTGRAGLPGNDDAGTMSSWFVWKAIGIYPNAGQNFYYIGSLLFTRLEFDLRNNRKFVIESVNASIENKFVQSTPLNGKTLNRAWLKHSEIAAGGKLILQISNKTSKWGSAVRPPSMSSK